MDAGGSGENIPPVLVGYECVFQHNEHLLSGVGYLCKRGRTADGSIISEEGRKSQEKLNLTNLASYGIVKPKNNAEGETMFFELFDILFTIAFVAVAVVIIVTAIRSLGQWAENNNSPRLTVPATVVAKRTNVDHHNGNDAAQYHSSTTYYATFQVESGDRMELRLAGNEYGLLVEGDKGKLSFQGTRFLGFERT